MGNRRLVDDLELGRLLRSARTAPGVRRAPRGTPFALGSYDGSGTGPGFSSFATAAIRGDEAEGSDPDWGDGDGTPLFALPLNGATPGGVAIAAHVDYRWVTGARAAVGCPCGPCDHPFGQPIKISVRLTNDAWPNIAPRGDDVLYEAVAAWVPGPVKSLSGTFGPQASPGYWDSGCFAGFNIDLAGNLAFGCPSAAYGPTLRRMYHRVFIYCSTASPMVGTSLPRSCSYLQVTDQFVYATCGRFADADAEAVCESQAKPSGVTTLNGTQGLFASRSQWSYDPAYSFGAGYTCSPWHFDARQVTGVGNTYHGEITLDYPVP